MSETDSYQQLLDDFGRQLDHAASRRRRPPSARRPLWIGLALATVAGIAVVLAGGGGTARLDVVAQAQAALSPPGGLVYMVTTTRVEAPGRTLVQPPPLPTQQWSTGTPERWRMAQNLPAHGNIHVVGPYGQVVGREEFSFANGTTEYYAREPNVLEITSGLSSDGPAATDLTAPLGTDPVVELRSMLDSGRLHDAGTRTLAGRAVRRLVGEESRGAKPPWPIEYDVDASTFRPVQVAIQMRTQSPAAPQTGTLTMIETVERYERLPLNPRTVRLLTIHPTGTPTVYRHRAGETPKHP
jgi:hypothetical protein